MQNSCLTLIHWSTFIKFIFISFNTMPCTLSRGLSHSILMSYTLTKKSGKNCAVRHHANNFTTTEEIRNERTKTFSTSCMLLLFLSLFPYFRLQFFQFLRQNIFTRMFWRFFINSVILQGVSSFGHSRNIFKRPKISLSMETKSSRNEIKFYFLCLISSKVLLLFLSTKKYFPRFSASSHWNFQKNCQQLAC